MNRSINRVLLFGLAACGAAAAQDDSSRYNNLIRQVQVGPDIVGELESDVMVPPSGGDLDSPLAINPGGARFELHTQLNVAPFTSFLLDSRYVGEYIPLAQIALSSEDTTWTQIPRTRADRPFYANVILEGIQAPGEGVPEAATTVKFLRHLQSYGAGGTDEDLDRSQAILHTQSQLSENGTHSFTFDITMVPGADRSKLRGEERFSIYSLEDYQAPEQQLVSKYIQIWPVADGTISGINQGDKIRFKIPTITLAANDLYPGSSLYAQVYKGEKRDDTVQGVDAFLVPGSHKSNPTINVPWNELLVLDDWDAVLTEDGRWTLELLTKTPFGVERLRDPSGQPAYVTFDINRTIIMNGSFTTIE